MSLSLPVIGSADRRLAEVLVSAFLAVRGESSPLGLAPVRRAIVVLVDGLGAVNLSKRIAHARTIGSLPRSEVSGGFPTTTASALATLMTGQSPGDHGIVGYAVRNPATGEIVNQLSSLDTVDVGQWQPVPTVWEQNTDIPSAILASPRYRDSGLTRAILRGTEYVDVHTYEERLSAASNFLSHNGSGVLYVYVPELDMAAHASGVNSDQWVRKLEELDGFIADLCRLMGKSDGLIITADHGVLDIPQHRHRIIPCDSSLTENVLIGGEPRFLHLYVSGDVEDMAQRWRDSEGGNAHIVLRDEAIAAGWFGSVRDSVRDRIGDILVSPRGESVYYDERTATPQSMAMVGQHGGFSRDETLIPLVRGGLFR